MVDCEKARILTIMKLLYFVIYNDLPLLQYVEQCQIHTLLSTFDMPTIVEYFSYTNVTIGMEFLSAISKHLKESLLSEVKLSLCYSILTDESTNRTCKPHLIVYLCYKNGGQGAPYIKFIESMPLSRGTGEVMFNSIRDLLRRCGLDLKKLVTILTNGALCITGVHQGVVVQLCVLIPHLVGTHYITHIEVLAAKDANKNFPHLDFIDKAANKVRLHLIYWLNHECYIISYIFACYKNQSSSLFENLCKCISGWGDLSFVKTLWQSYW